MAIQQLKRTPAETAYADAMGEAARVLPRADWLEPVRAAGRELVTAQGLPHRRLEAWRWTDLRALIDGAFPPRLAREEAVAAPEGASPFEAIERYVAVFVDGTLRKDLSDIAGLEKEIEVHALAGDPDDAPDWLRTTLGNAYAEEGDVVAALNAAFFADGLGLRVPAGVHLSRPLELRFHNSATVPQTLFTRFVVVVEDGASATIIESHGGAAGGRYVTNGVCAVFVASRGRLDHVKLQDESLEAVHVENVHATLEEEANYSLFTLNAGARVARQQVFAKLAGSEGHLDVAGAYVLGGRQHCDTALTVDHAVAGCTSNELFKCVMDDNARGIFQGKIIVRPDAQKTDGYQMSQALLLSERAEFDAKPELEIFADDVRCSHGATSGELDEDLMFYLRSRGIPESEAKSLLIVAFVAEAVERVADERLREVLTGFASTWLERQARQ